MLASLATCRAYQPKLAPASTNSPGGEVEIDCAIQRVSSGSCAPYFAIWRPSASRRWAWKASPDAAGARNVGCQGRNHAKAYASAPRGRSGSDRALTADVDRKPASDQEIARSHPPPGALRAPTCPLQGQGAHKSHPPRRGG